MKGVITLLQNDATLIAMLNSGANSVFSIDAPQGEKTPHIVMDGGDKEPLGTFSATSTDEVRITIYSISRYLYNSGANIGSYEIANRIRTILDEYSGTSNGEVYSKITLESQSPPYIANDIIEIEQIFQIFNQIWNGY